MKENDWKNSENRFLGVYLCGKLDCLDDKGEPMNDNDFFLAFNAGDKPLEFTVPGRDGGGKWQEVLNTADTEGAKPPRGFKDESKVAMAEHSTVVLKNVK